MITPSTRALFPRCQTFGFTSRPEYLVNVTERIGGHERRDLKWQYPLHYYDGAPMGRKRQAEIEAVRDFYHAMRARFTRFRFKDWADYKSGPLDDDPTALDQPIQLTAGSPGGYQLSKQYTVDAFTTLRLIQHPKGDTIRIANQAGIEQDASTWTIDEDTGYLTTTGGFSGTPTTWGGEFYVPCRFDAPIEVEIVSHKVFSCSVTLKELRPEE
jgi:uncharacterized protein (TIGR02217 family)